MPPKDITLNITPEMFKLQNENRKLRHKLAQSPSVLPVLSTCWIGSHFLTLTTDTAVIDDAMAVRLDTQEVLRPIGKTLTDSAVVMVPDGDVPEGAVVCQDVWCIWETVPELRVWLSCGKDALEVNLIDRREVRPARNGAGE